MSSPYKHEISPSGEPPTSVAAIRSVPRYSQLIGRRESGPEPTGEQPTIIAKMLNYRQPPKQRSLRQQPKVDA